MSTFHNNSLLTVIQDLTFLSKIQPGDKISLNSRTYIPKNSWFSSFYRYLHDDSRTKTLDFLRSLHTRCMELVLSLSHSDLSSLHTHISNASLGISNLKHTYKYDPSTLNSLDEIISLFSNLTSSIHSRLFRFNSDILDYDSDDNTSNIFDSYLEFHLDPPSPPPHLSIPYLPSHSDPIPSHPIPSTTPISDPIPSTTPVSDPIPSTTPISDPIPSTTPVSDPIPSTTPVSDPIPTITPVSDPIPSTTPVFDPIPSTTPVFDPIATITPVSDPISVTLNNVITQQVSCEDNSTENKRKSTRNKSKTKAKNKTRKLKDKQVREKKINADIQTISSDSTNELSGGDDDDVDRYIFSPTCVPHLKLLFTNNGPSSYPTKFLCSNQNTDERFSSNTSKHNSPVSKKKVSNSSNNFYEKKYLDMLYD